MAKKAYVYDGSAWQDLASSTTDLSGLVQKSGDSMTGNLTTTGDISANTGNTDGGVVVRPWTGGSSYNSIATTNMTGNEYIALSDGTNTYVSAGTSGNVLIRPDANTSSLGAAINASGAHTISGMPWTGIVGGVGQSTSGANLTVTHGLGQTPSSVVATVRSNTYSSANNTNIFVGNIGSTTFTLFCNNGAGGAVSAAFSWMACG